MMMMTTRRGPRGGFFLINMLMAIGLLAAFVIVAERVFRLSLLTTSRVAMAQDSGGRLERAMGVLRADVWGGGKVEMKDSRVWVTDAEGRVVEWRTETERGDLVRKSGENERRWPGLGLAFRYEAGLLSVAGRSGEVAVMRRAGGAR